MNRKPVSEEIKRRAPRFILSLVIAFFLWIIVLLAPSIVGDIMIPGLNVEASWLVLVTTTLILSIFLIRAMADALVLADIVTDVIVKRLGVKEEERTLKRAARDAVYIIIAISLSTAVLPFLSSVPQIGGLLTATVSLITLGFFLLLMYDIGRILYRVLAEKAEKFADRIVEATW